MFGLFLRRIYVSVTFEKKKEKLKEHGDFPHTTTSHGVSNNFTEESIFVFYSLNYLRQVMRRKG